MTRYYVKGLVARLRASPGLFALTVLGVALGVASVFSVQLVNGNAVGAFAASVRAVSGEAELSVVGRGPTFPEARYVDILAEPGVAAAWPLYRVDVALEGREAGFLEVVGVDLFAPSRLPWPGGTGELGEALTRPGWVAVTPALARRQGWRIGDPVWVTSGSRRVRLEVGALVDFQRKSPLASPRLAVMDLSQLQALLGRPGEIHQVDLRLAPGTAPAELRHRLSARLGSTVEVLTPADRERGAAELLGAFRLNLTALSLVSLVVGLFVVHTSTRASLVRRRVELGLLRALGASRGQVLGLVLGEVALLGTLGVAIGLPLGYWVAAANVRAVSATLTGLYLLEAIEALAVPSGLVALAAFTGLGGALTGAALPALEAARRDARTLLSAPTLSERARAAAGPLALGGLGLLGVVALWFAAIGHAWRPGGWALGVALLLAMPLVTPWCVRLACGRVTVRGLGVGFALRSLGARLGSTAFAVASTAIAVSMLIGITLMIGSFRRTVELWVDASVRADVYVTTASWSRARQEAPLDEALASALAQHPGVVAVDRLRQFLGFSGDRRIAVSGVEMSLPGGQARFPFLPGVRPAEALRRVREEGAVLVSEPLARKAGLSVGDRIRVAGASGAGDFAVAGVYYDYRSESGAVVMDLGTMTERFGPGPISNVALYLRPGLDADWIVDELRRRFPEAPLQLRSNRRLRAEILRIFDQTFAVTGILQGMSLLVAVAGIMLTLLVLAREQAAELALYRALGALPRQLFWLFVGKGLGMGVLALALGLAGGVLLAGILVFVINRVYFGWTIQVHWPWAALLQQVTTILAAAVAASLYPALAASRTPATGLSRDDL